MNIKLLLFKLLSVCILATFSCNSAEQQEEHTTKNEERPPNVVFILIDDLGWADLPCYGNKFNEAPNIDRLRQQGMQFMNAYAACPVCSPTRASIQSGQYPARVGIIDFITGHWRPYEALTVPKNRTQHLPLEIETLGEMMKDAGYATGYFGKWHLGNGDYMPGNQGYDDWRVHRGGAFTQLKSRNAIVPMDSTVTDSIRLSELLTDYSVNFLAQHQHEPFFLFLAHYDVHIALDADKDLIDKYLNKEKPDNYPANAIYAAMIAHVDRSVGRVMKTLEELGLDENTMVVFFSDNGGLVGRYDNKGEVNKRPLMVNELRDIYEGTDLQFTVTSNAPLRNEKGTVYEGGIREPLLVKWPGMIEQGSTSQQLVSSVDFYPTLLELVGANQPDGQTLDGESILGQLMGEEEEEERTLYWHYPVYHHDVPASAVRKGDFKLIDFLGEDKVELYNLAEDIGETTDVSADQVEKVQELMGILDVWRKEVDARFPVENPDFDPERRYEWGKHPDRS